MWYQPTDSNCSACVFYYLFLFGSRESGNPSGEFTRIFFTVVNVVLVALALLPYFGGDFPLGRFGPEPTTLWDLTTREPVILTVVGVAAIAAAARGLLADEPILLTLATGFSFYLFGRVFPVGAPTYGFYGVGFWVVTAAAFTMSVGGVLAVAGWRFATPS